MLLTANNESIFYYITKNQKADNPQVGSVTQSGGGIRLESWYLLVLPFLVVRLQPFYPFTDPIQEEIGIVTKRKLFFNSCLSVLGKDCLGMSWSLPLWSWWTELGYKTLLEGKLGRLESYFLEVSVKSWGERGWEWVLDEPNECLPQIDWENQDSSTGKFDFKGHIPFIIPYCCYMNIN